MIDHDEARVLASARADGELEDSATLDQHMASCTACREFADGLGSLSALVEALPREHAPAGLDEKVVESITVIPMRSRRRRILIATPAIAAAVAMAVALFVLAPLPRFALRDAGAAEALAKLSSFYVERQIDELDAGGGVEKSTHEKIWYRAPGLIRIERTITAGPLGPTHETIIRRPGLEYVARQGTSAFVTRNVPPTGDFLPEPLSPTLAFYGTRDGPGPVIAGRPTTRVVFETQSEKRIAYVDASDFTVLGAEDSFVLGKQSVVLGKQEFGGLRLRVRKTTQDVRYNLAIGDEMFAVPRGGSEIDGGFRTGSVGLSPRAEPEGFSRLASGSGPDGDSVLYVRGALPVLVRIARDSGTGAPDELERTESVSIGARPANLIVGIYTLPRIEFIDHGRLVSISSPLPRIALIALARSMYPA